jgi:hypothetical protein
MGMNSLTGPALQGINHGFQGLRRVASTIAGAPQNQSTEATDLSRSMVELKQHATAIQASSKTLKHIDQAIGTLFDDHA